MARAFPSLHFFMDESGQTTDRFMGVGGIVARPERLSEIRTDVERIKRAADIGSEMKWSAARKARESAYVALIDYFFSLLEGNHIHFHVLLCDFDKFDHKAAGGRKSSVSRMFYQLALHRACKPYGERTDILLYPDSGDYANELQRFGAHLNNDARRFIHPQRCWAKSPVWHIEPTNSSREPMLQLNDVILGGIVSRRNSRDKLPEASDHKKRLSAYVSERAGMDRFERNTPQDIRRFTVWNFDFNRLHPK